MVMRSRARIAYEIFGSADGRAEGAGEASGASVGDARRVMRSRTRSAYKLIDFQRIH